MNLMEIYGEIIQNKDEEYYVKLSKTEPLLIPFIIETVSDGSSSERIKFANVLEKISRTQPYQLAVFASYIINAISKNNDLGTWCLWKSLSNIFDLIESEDLENEYFKALNSNILGEYSIACDCSVKYIQSRPESKDKIIEILKNIENRKFIVNGSVSESSGKIAAEKTQIIIDELSGV